MHSWSPLAVLNGRIRCLAVAAGLILAVLGQCQSLRAQPAVVDENALKLAFIFNFITFTEWPARNTAESDIRLCALGGEALGGALNALDGRVANTRIIQVKRVSTVNEAQQCDLLFIDPMGGRVPAPFLGELGDSPVLTVSDAENFAKSGGMIGLLKRNNRIAFEINLATATRAGLRFSAKLLNLAIVVPQ